MKKFEIEVKRIDQYQISIDPTVWTPEALKEWSSVFFEINDLKEFAEHIAISLLRFGTGTLIEGLGRIEELDSKGKPKYNSVHEEGYYTEGITVYSMFEDEEFETETIVL